MITCKTLSFNNYSQQSYDNDIRSIDLSKVKCTCGSTGNFHRHATYQRYLVLDDKDTIILEIVQIKCESCNRTHAILPSIIIPYRILSNSAIINVIKSYRNITDSYAVISKMTGFCDFDFILHYFYEYHTMFMQRISLNNMTVYT